MPMVSYQGGRAGRRFAERSWEACLWTRAAEWSRRPMVGWLGAVEDQWWVCGFADGCSYKVSSWYAPEMLKPSRQ